MFRLNEFYKIELIRINRHIKILNYWNIQYSAIKIIYWFKL